MVAKKKADSSPTPVLTSPDAARPMDTAPTPMDTTSTPTPFFHMWLQSP